MSRHDVPPLHAPHHACSRSHLSLIPPGLRHNTLTFVSQEEPMFKRGVAEGDNEGGALVKKVRYEDDDNSSSSNALTTFTYRGGELVTKKNEKAVVLRLYAYFIFFLFCLYWIPFCLNCINSFAHVASLSDQENVFFRCTNDESIRP